MPKSEKFPWLKEYPSHIKWNDHLNCEPSLCEMFDKVTQEFADKPFLDFFGKIYTYQDFREYVLAAAHGLEKMGIKKSSIYIFMF